MATLESRLVALERCTKTKGPAGMSHAKRHAFRKLMDILTGRFGLSFLDVGGEPELYAPHLPADLLHALGVTGSEFIALLRGVGDAV